MCLAQRPQRSGTGEARTRGPSVSSQALYHWATALPTHGLIKLYLHNIMQCYNGLQSEWVIVFVNAQEPRDRTRDPLVQGK